MQQAIAPVSTARRSRQNLLSHRLKKSSTLGGLFEQLEGRRLMSAGGNATADFTNNQDVIIAGDAITFLGTSAGETYHLSAAAGQLTVTSTTQGTYTRSLNGLNAIYWYGNGGNDTLFVDALNGPTLNINGGSGNDVFHVGNGDLDGNATNTITITDSADFDTLVLSDILDSGADTFTFDTGSSFTKPGVQVKYGDTDRVEFLATGNADTIYVKSLNTETQYSLGG